MTLYVTTWFITFYMFALTHFLYSQDKDYVLFVKPMMLYSKIFVAVCCFSCYVNFMMN